MPNVFASPDTAAEAAPNSPQGASPLWVAFGRRWTWLGALPVILAALVPFFDPRLPVSTDGYIHLNRLIEMDWLVQHGIWWPRYAPDLVYGYGYPVFNYYAPLVYFAGLGLHGLGFGFVAVLKIMLGSTIVLGALGAYKLTRAWFKAEAAYVAAALYAFAPYILFNTLGRCTLAESMGLALQPWLLWAGVSFISTPRAGNFARLTLIYALLIFAHNLSAVTGTALLAVFVAVELLNVARQSHWQQSAGRIGGLGLALGLGVLISAYFWAPAILETGYVQLSRLTTPDIFNFHHHFLSLLELLGLPQPFDIRLVTPSLPVAFGFPAAGLALIGGLSLYRYRDGAMRARLACLSVAWLATLLMALPVSTPLWEHLPLLPMFQFPWRFLGPATILAAVLGGAAFSQLASPRWTLGLAGGALGVIVFYAFSWTFATYYPLTRPPELRDVPVYEARTGMIGTTATGEYLPVAVTTLPPAAPQVARYAQTNIIDRLDAQSLPPGVTVVQTASQVLSAQATVSATQPYTVTFLWLYFPGWQARLDGRPAAITPSVPYGFITLAVPAGQHILEVSFGSTPLRDGAGLVSVLGLILLGVSLFWRKGWPVDLRGLQSAPPPSAALWVLVILGLGLAGLRVYLGNRDSLFRYSRYDGQQVAGIDQILNFNFGDILNLIGLDSALTSPADKPLDVTLYWRAYDTPPTDYSISLQLVDAQGHQFGQKNSYHPGGYPTSSWSSDNYQPDAHALTAYAGTPPGRYYLRVGVYPEASGGPNLDAFDADHQPLGNSVEVAVVELTAPSRAPTDAELSPQAVRQQALGPLTLVGLDQPALTANSGDLIPLVFYWRVTAPLTAPVMANLELQSADGVVTALGTFVPGPAEIPSADWQMGSAWRVPQDVILPPTVPAGPAQLQVRLTTAASQGLGGPVNVGALTIAVPQRQLNVPPMRVSQAHPFSASFRLLGFDREPQAALPGQPLTVTLYWQATAITTQTCKVFIHILDAAGQIVAQNDAAPAGGLRPTTGWLPPEVIADGHTLALPADLPAGRYTLRVGMYNTLTQERIPVLDAAQAPQGDFVDVEQFQVGP